MKCKYCNAELENSAKFWRFCGRKQDSEAVGNQPQKGKSKAKYIIIPIAITAGLLSLLMVAGIIGLIVFFVLGGNSVEDVRYEEPNLELDTTENDYYGDSFYDTDYSTEYEETEPETTYVEEETTAAPETEAPVIYEDNQRVVIAHGGLRIRNKPDLTYGAIVGLIPNGTLLTVDRIEGNWAYVGVDGVFGWCSCDFLFEPYSYSGRPIYRATANYYKGVDLIPENHGTDPGFYTIIPDGESVYVYAIEGDRAFVSYNNIYGWCSTEHLTMQDLP